jgi:hypothetical protein
MFLNRRVFCTVRLSMFHFLTIINLSLSSPYDCFLDQFLQFVSLCTKYCLIRKRMTCVGPIGITTVYSRFLLKHTKMSLKYFACLYNFNSRRFMFPVE